MNKEHAKAAARELVKTADDVDPEDAASLERAAIALTVAAQAFGLEVTSTGSEELRFSPRRIGTFPPGADGPR